VYLQGEGKQRNVKSDKNNLEWAKPLQRLDKTEQTQYNSLETLYYNVAFDFRPLMRLSIFRSEARKEVYKWPRNSN